MTCAQTCEPPLLNSTRLSLRGITATDTPALFEIYSDRKTLEYWGKEPVKTPAEAWAMVGKPEACSGWQRTALGYHP